jgi:predicted  nucleic acid-binding Zn-ribbon protein
MRALDTGTLPLKKSSLDAIRDKVKAKLTEMKALHDEVVELQSDLDLVIDTMDEVTECLTFIDTTLEKHV